jgi:hypothetical protein
MTPYLSDRVGCPLDSPVVCRTGLGIPQSVPETFTDVNASDGGCRTMRKGFEGTCCRWHRRLWSRPRHSRGKASACFTFTG